MHYRKLGKTNYEISEVAFGAWAIGGTWGANNDNVSNDALDKALEMGVTFFDTADVYGGGHSERLLGEVKKSTDKKMIIATKAGRGLNPHVYEGYNLENIRAFVEQSLVNLQVERLDLLQLHCPPTQVFDNEAFFEDLKSLIDEGKIAHLGVSVEKVSEAMRAIEYDHVSTVQIIFNMFRLKPAEVFLQKAKEKNVGVIARVPLASGMLTGKMTKDTKFAADDHRSFNRNGESFDKGETFSGVPYEIGLKAVEALEEIKPEGLSMAQFALAWILQHEAVSCVIPGGRTPEQVASNVGASGVKLTEETMLGVEAIYNQYIKEHVHHLW